MWLTGEAVLFFVWLVGGVISYGAALGKWTRDFPDQEHFYDALTFGVASWAGIPAVLSDPPYHFRLRPLSREERWEYFKTRFPSLGRGFFEETR